MRDIAGLFASGGLLGGLAGHSGNLPAYNTAFSSGHGDRLPGVIGCSENEKRRCFLLQKTGLKPALGGYAAGKS